MGGPVAGDTFVYVGTLLPVVAGIAWSAVQWRAVSNVKIDGHPALLGTQVDARGNGKPNEDIVADMIKISDTISHGAMSFLKAEYRYMFVYVAAFSGVLLIATWIPKSFSFGVASTLAFVVGAFTSILCGWIGMRIAVFTNVRTTHQCWKDLRSGFDVAIQGGSVMGLSLVSLGLLGLFLLVALFRSIFPSFTTEDLFDAVAGYGLGGSSIALFGRVGGGIYTKAADVGADLSGKNEYGLEEDDYRNPACIADNVGDNVGDIAGMGADLFGSFAESTCAALVLAAAAHDLTNVDLPFVSLMYPVLLSSFGVLVGIITLGLQRAIYPVNSQESVEKALKGILVISTVLMSPVAIILPLICLPSEFKVRDRVNPVQSWYCAVAVLLGLWSGLVIGYVTEYYTSHSYTPVREIAETQKQSAATGIIYGLALGYLSCIVPVVCLGITILIAIKLCGMYGVALGALGMLGTMTMALTIDAYGPISDNAGGIAEMAELPPSVRELTDCLDAAGNTTAAVGKGFAIGSAALVSLALFGAFTVRAEVENLNFLDAWVFTGVLYGAMMPYAFAAWTMKSVGWAANEMLKECMRQFPGIMNGTAAPDYDRCIRISTEASLREMIAPGALVILSPLVAGIVFGKNTCAGLLGGALVSSVQLAISMSNSGGAWDNAKKYISAGHLGEGFQKGSEAHKNSVTGDTVGDPLKDTSGPALNIVMKLTAIISLVFASAIKACSNKETGGPRWSS